jgi:hypothetical protein
MHRGELRCNIEVSVAVRGGRGVQYADSDRLKHRRPSRNSIEGRTLPGIHKTLTEHRCGSHSKNSPTSEVDEEVTMSQN